MIYGIGMDIVNVERFAKIVGRYPDRFVEKYFNPEEVGKYKGLDAEHFAGKMAKLFAAKEAFAKALGTGWRDGLQWKDVAVLSDGMGRPQVEVRGTVREYIEKSVAPISGVRIHVTTSDDAPFAAAFAVIEMA
ncbi:MAG: holo-ACP synthase [Rickettsiales bacterium]|jgi:holo-[acyl-carrier protein] synthase|nr:holo-ACP synthase [Rickettsiales bacterium]